MITLALTRGLVVRPKYVDPLSDELAAKCADLAERSTTQYMSSDMDYDVVVGWKIDEVRLDAARRFIREQAEKNVKALLSATISTKSRGVMRIVFETIGQGHPDLSDATYRAALEDFAASFTCIPELLTMSELVGLFWGRISAPNQQVSGGGPLDCARNFDMELGYTRHSLIGDVCGLPGFGGVRGKMRIPDTEMYIERASAEMIVGDLRYMAEDRSDVIVFVREIRRENEEKALAVWHTLEPDFPVFVPVRLTRWQKIKKFICE